MNRRPTNAPPPQTFTARVLSYACIFFVNGVVLITVAAYFDSWHYVFNPLPHFKAFYAILAIVAVASCAVLRRWRWFVVAGVCAAVNLYDVIPWYVPRADVNPIAEANLRIVEINVETSNNHSDILAKWLTENDPQVILLQEMDNRWIDALGYVREHFPFRFEDPKPEGGGIVLWSTIPLEGVSAGSLGNVKAPPCRPTSQWGRRVFTLSHCMRGRPEYARRSRAATNSWRPPADSPANNRSVWSSATSIRPCGLRDTACSNVSRAW